MRTDATTLTHSPRARTSVVRLSPSWSGPSRRTPDASDILAAEYDRAARATPTARAARAARRGTGAAAGDAQARPSAWETYLTTLDYDVPDGEVQRELARRARGGDDDARAALICANRRFVVQVARTFQHRGMDLQDLVAEGNLGLLRAADKYDPDRPVKFISYAVWWIRQAIQQALAEQAACVRIPQNRQQTRALLARVEQELAATLGRRPSVEEVATAAKVSLDVARALDGLRHGALSLDAPAGDGSGAPLRDVLPLEAGEAGATGGPVAHVLLDEQQREIAEALAGLSPREQRILTLYFGLDGSDPLTLEQIGQRLGVTRERIRQIRERALERLRANRALASLTTVA